MAHHRARPRKSDGETFDMFDISRKPKSLQQEEKLPRFAKVIANHGYTEETDLRANFVRYLEDEVLPIAFKRQDTNMQTVAEQSARAYRHYEHLQYLAAHMAHRLNRGEEPHETILQTSATERAETEANIADAVQQALKAYNRIKHYLDEDRAMLLEIPYMALRGSKSLLIIASKRGPQYGRWAQKYPLLWTFHKGPPDEDEDLLIAADMEDDKDLFANGNTHNRLNHSPRPMWWGDMALGPFSRTCRKLVPLNKVEKAKRLHTPAMLYHWRTRSKKGEMLGPADDYRA